MTIKKLLDEEVYILFLEGFFEGRYHAGQKIEPNELAARFDISRTPVVQALKRLSGDKILDVGSTGKYYIPVPTEKRLYEVCQLRCLLEQYAISILISNNDREVLNKLYRQTENCSKELSRQNTVESVKMDLAFHQMLVESTGNGVLTDAYLPVLRQYIGIKYSIKHQYDTQYQAAERHLETIRYILDGEEERAKESMATHIRLPMLRMAELLKEEYENKIEKA